MDKKIYNLVGVFLILNLGCFILDIFNIPSRIGINMNQLNWNLWPLIFGNSVVLLIAITTYFLIDKRNNEKENNREKTAISLLLMACEESKEMVEIFLNKQARTSAVKKCDFNKLMFQDSVLTHYLNHPFAFHENIVNMACEGIITKYEFDSYISLRKKYKTCINCMVTLYDRPEIFQIRVDEYYEVLNKFSNYLNKKN